MSFLYELVITCSPSRCCRETMRFLRGEKGIILTLTDFSQQPVFYLPYTKDVVNKWGEWQELEWCLLFHFNSASACGQPEHLRHWLNHHARAVAASRGRYWLHCDLWTHQCHSSDQAQRGGSPLFLYLGSSWAVTVVESPLRGSLLVSSFIALHAKQKTD